MITIQKTAIKWCIAKAKEAEVRAGCNDLSEKECKLFNLNYNKHGTNAIIKIAKEVMK